MPKLISHIDANNALLNGQRVNFHWRGLSVEVNKSTTLEDLRWLLRDKKSVWYLTVKDVVSGNYSII